MNTRKKTAQDSEREARPECPETYSGQAYAGNDEGFARRLFEELGRLARREREASADADDWLFNRVREAAPAIIAARELGMQPPFDVREARNQADEKASRATEALRMEAFERIDGIVFPRIASQEALRTNRVLPVCITPREIVRRGEVLKRFKAARPLTPEICRCAWEELGGDDYQFCLLVRARAHAEGIPFKQRLWLDDAPELTALAGMAAKRLAAFATPEQLEDESVLNELVGVARYGIDGSGRDVLEYSPVTGMPVSVPEPYMGGDPREDYEEKRAC